MKQILKNKKTEKFNCHAAFSGSLNAKASSVLNSNPQAGKPEGEYGAEFLVSDNYKESEDPWNFFGKAEKIGMTFSSNSVAESIDDIISARGRSMIEMLGVLAIIGVLSVGGIAGYSKAMHRYRVNKTIDQITYIAGSVRAFFAPQKSYEGLTNGDTAGRNLLKKAKLVPEEMWDGNDLRNAFDSRVNVYAGVKIDNDACYDDPVCSYQAFRIDLDEVSAEFCIDLITHDWREVNATALSLYGYGSAIVELLTPVDLQDAVKACSRVTGEDDDSVWIDFKFDFDPTQGDYPQSIAESRALLDAM